MIIECIQKAWQSWLEFWTWAVETGCWEAQPSMVAVRVAVLSPECKAERDDALLRGGAILTRYQMIRHFEHTSATLISRHPCSSHQKNLRTASTARIPRLARPIPMPLRRLFCSQSQPLSVIRCHYKHTVPPVLAHLSPPPRLSQGDSPGGHCI